MPQERKRKLILKIYEQGMNVSDPVDWWFTSCERHVRVMLFGRAVFPCRVLGSPSCNATAFRAASHMAMALIGVLNNDKRNLRGRFSAFPSIAPWHTSLPPGEEQPTGSPTKAPLLEWVIGVLKRRMAFSRCAGRDWRKQRPELLYTFFSCFNCLQVCRFWGRKGHGRVRTDMN